MDFDLQTVMEETIDLLAEQAQNKDLELVGIVEPEVPIALRGDPGRLRQVLVNLLGNAVKFTEEGEVLLRARLLEETEDKALIRFYVSDTGIGMSEEQQRGGFLSPSPRPTPPPPAATAAQDWGLPSLSNW
jgi:signal transduction histidine kinase